MHALALALAATLLLAQPCEAKQRIISLAPSLTEILYAIGAESDVVAVSDYCNYPAAVSKKPHVGACYRLNVERIMALQPTLILSPENQSSSLSQLRNLTHTKVRVIKTQGVASIFRNIEEIGRLSGHQPQANALSKRLRQRIAAITAKRPKNHPKVFYYLWNDPLMTAGKGSYIDDLITLAGGKNVAGSLPMLYPTYSWEALIASNADVVFGPENLSGSLSQLKKRRELKAAQTGRIYTLNADLLSRPGPRVDQALQAVNRIISSP